MPLRERRELPAVIVAANQVYQTEFQGAPIRKIASRLTGTYAASAASNTGLESTLGFGGRFQIYQNEEALIDLDSGDFRHLGLFKNGTETELGPVSIATSGIALGQEEVDLETFLPGCRIDARGSKVYRRGQFLSLQRFGGNVTSVTGTLQTTVETGEIVGESWFEPRWKQGVIQCNVASQSLTHTYRCGKVREYVGGIMLRQYDHSEVELAGPNPGRPDGLVRRVKVTLENREGSREVWKSTWGMLKLQQAVRFNVDRNEIHSGVGMIVFDDPDTPDLAESLILEPGDSLTVEVDTLTAVEAEFTAVTPDSGDACIVTFFSHILRGAAAGEGGEALRARARQDLERRAARRNAPSRG